MMDDQTSQQKKDSRILYIILVWVGVIVIAIASFMIFGNSSGKNIKQLDLKWNDIQFGEVVDANFTWEDVVTNLTAEQLKSIIGVSPVVEAPLFSNFSIGGVRKYIPIGASGDPVTDQMSVGIQFQDDSDEKRTVLSIVSNTSDLTLQFPNAEYNHDLRNTGEVWTMVGENRCKLYRIYAESLVSQYSYAIFEKDGHFWHIEFANMTDDEIAEVLYYAMLPTGK
ncbi:MAG TPA: hypothetical protein PK854_07855 [Oscillospiraceae bacterium]|nr:hypothetical protein [Oscillospiraceae bacterium]HPS35165.1 hypothetical protein [Oscillospiraceae bacterium]